MNLLTNANPVEILWACWCAYTLWHCYKRLRAAFLDRDAANSDESSAIAADIVLRSKDRMFRESVYFSIAFRSILLSPQPDPGNQFISALVGFAFIGLAVRDLFECRREERTQGRLLSEKIKREKAERERVEAAQRDPRTYGVRASDRVELPVAQPDVEVHIEAAQRQVLNDPTVLVDRRRGSRSHFHRGRDIEGTEEGQEEE